MPERKYKVAYVTGSRADYGIVRGYLSYLAKDKQIDFSVLVTGAHTDSRFGSTRSIIAADGFRIDYTVDLHIDTASVASTLESVAVAVKEFGRYFEEHKYDLLILLGDRYEMMAVAQAAAMQRIPILHLHGGEVTYGNYDEFIRHCITKMSRFHFAATALYRERIIQMGEHPDTVFDMGALGAENCTRIDETAVCAAVKALKPKEYFVVAFHPETLTDVNLEKQVEQVIGALQFLPDRYEVVLIGTNADTGSDVIREQWLRFAKRRGVRYFESLNTDSYLYLVKNAIALVGNSSSGIIEAPSLGVRSVNIGDRQRGRVRANSVIDVACDAEEIVKALENVIACYKEKWTFDNPYYQEDVALRCYEKTKEILSGAISGPKEFYDLKRSRLDGFAKE